jgi:hypothetical protein
VVATFELILPGHQCKNRKSNLQVRHQRLSPTNRAHNIPLVALIRRCPKVFILLLCGHGSPPKVPLSITLDKVDLGQDEEDDVAADDADEGAVTAVAGERKVSISCRREKAGMRTSMACHLEERYEQCRDYRRNRSRTLSIDITCDQGTRLHRHVVDGTGDGPRTNTSGILGKHYISPSRDRHNIIPTYTTCQRNEQRMAVRVTEQQSEDCPLDPFASRVGDGDDDDQEDELPPGSQGRYEHAFFELFGGEYEGEVEEHEEDVVGDHEHVGLEC